MADVALLMEEYLWEKRVVLMFSPSSSDPEYVAQNSIFSSDISGIKAREIVVWRIVKDQYVSVDGRKKPHLGTPPFYEYFHVDSEKFHVILLGKDGEEKLRQARALDITTLFERIDAMPMRVREMHKNVLQ